jgi:hypothetical protein
MSEGMSLNDLGQFEKIFFPEGEVVKVGVIDSFADLQNKNLTLKCKILTGQYSGRDYSIRINHYLKDGAELTQSQKKKIIPYLKIAYNNVDPNQKLTWWNDEGRPFFGKEFTFRADKVDTFNGNPFQRLINPQLDVSNMQTEPTKMGPEQAEPAKKDIPWA